MAAVAAVELVLLVVIGGALLARSEPAAPAAKARAAKAVAAKTSAPKAAARRSVAAQAELPRRKVKVVVLNGNGRTGAAAAAASRVSHRGYRLGVVGNAPSHDYPRSIVMYRTGFAARGPSARARPRRPDRLAARRDPAAPAPRRARRAHPRRLSAHRSQAPALTASRVTSSGPPGTQRLPLGSSVYEALSAVYAAHWSPVAM